MDKMISFKIAEVEDFDFYYELKCEEFFPIDGENKKMNLWKWSTSNE